MVLQNIRSNTASKRPLASGLSDGQIAVNTNETSPGLFFKGADGAVLKVGPVHVGTSAPNSSPATGGSTGNSVGEQWLDTSNSGFVFKIWDGTDWRSETGQFVDVTGDTMTGNLTISGADLVMQNGEIIAASGAEATPSITFDGDLGTGFYKPAAGKLGISTGGTSRVIIDDSGLVGIGTTAPGVKLQVENSGADANVVINRPDAAISGNLNIASGNSTNYIFSSGAKPLQIATNNTERLRITSDGLVGIGTSAPGSSLEIRNDNTTTYDATEDGGQRANTATILVANENGTTNTFSQLVFDTAGANQSIARIAAIRTGVSTNDLAFVVEGSNTKREALRITGAGNVGIGTTNPGRNLTVDGGTGTIIAAFQSTGTGCGFGLKDATTSADNIVTIRAIGNDLVSHAGGQERMRIDSSGRLLVGTSNTTTTGTLFLQGISGNPSSGAYIHLQRGNVPSGSGFPIGSIFFADNGSNLGASIASASEGAWTSGSSHPSRLVFLTTADAAVTPTERMRIKSNGSILFANDNESGILAGTVNGKAILSSGIMYSARATTSAASHIIFTNTNGIVGQISTSGSNTAFSTASDYRLKENVVPLANAADRLNQLQVHRFNFIADPDTTVDGFLAHEAQTVVPECVTGTKDEVDDEGNPVYQGIDQSKMVPLAVAAIQEALVKIESLEQRLTDAGL